MTNPRFSVVIPTRERATTLRSSLRTCLNQDFDDYEIVVCDNCSSPATREVVDDAAEPRVRYLRSPEVLSMSSNWDLAVGQARGEYVIVLGDDDGLLRHALRELDGHIRQTGAKAVRWASAHYTWPDIALPGQGNALLLPLSREVRTVDSRAAIAEVIAFRESYATLPMVYSAAVHRDLIAAHRRKAGRVFPSAYPDVYSGFSMAWLAGEYLSIDLPMMVAGSSGRSYGIANLFLRGRSPLDSEFREQNAQERLPTHPWVPDLSIFPHIPVADAFLIAKQFLFPEEHSLRLDRRQFIAGCVRGIRAYDEAEWSDALALIRGTLADDPPLQEWFDATFADQPFAPAAPFQIRNPNAGFDGNSLHLAAERFGVVDVFGAAQLCQNILGITGGPIQYGLKSCSRLSAEWTAARGEIDEAHRVIARSQSETQLAREEMARYRVEVDRLRADHRRYRSRLPNRILDWAYHLCQRIGFARTPSGAQRV